MMNLKFYAIIALSSFTAMIYLPNSLSNVDIQPELKFVEDKGYLETLRNHLEAEIAAEEKPKSFFDYSFKDLLELMSLKPRVKEELPLPSLILKYVEVKLRKTLQSEDSSKNINSAFCGLALGLFTYQVIYTVLEYAITYVVSTVYKAFVKLILMAKLGAFKVRRIIAKIFQAPCIFGKSLVKAVGIYILNTILVICSIVSRAFCSMCFFISRIFANDTPDLNAAYGNIVTNEQNEIILTDSENDQSIDTNEQNEGALPESASGDDEYMLQKKPRAKYISKLKKINGKDIKKNDADFYNYMYRYAGNYGSKIPRLNSMKEQLF